MTKLIDVHSHVQFNYFDDDRAAVMKRSLEELETIINVGADPESSRRAVEDAATWPIYAAVGYHPEVAGRISQADLHELKELTSKPRVVAIGEIGLDNPNVDPEVEYDLTKQMDLLETQLELARETGLPIIFHCRNAYDALINIIKNQQFEAKGLIHCWMGSLDHMKEFLDLGLGISFTGNVTYKKNDYIREAAKLVPLERLFVETDCPFLPPQPIRGERNEPKFVKMIADCIAETRGVPVEQIIEKTNNNSKLLFNLT